MSQELPLPSKIEIDVTLSQIFDSTVPATPDVANYGYLYKKTTNDGLFWLTQGAGEINLADGGGGLSSFGTAATLDGNEVAVPNSTKGGTSALLTAGASENTACNTAFGYGSLFSLPDTADIGGFTSVGYNAGGSIADGLYSTFIGHLCATSLTYSQNDIFIGANLALNVATASGGSNIFVGNDSIGGDSFVGSGNICIGGNIMKTGVSTASDNIAIGNLAGNGLDTSTHSIMIGPLSGLNLSTGNSCVAIGASSMTQNVSTTGMVCIGASALSQTTGIGNTAVGFQAGTSITSGTNNSIFGYNAGLSSATLSNCVVMGASSKANSANQIRIGFGTAQASVQTNTYIDGIVGQTTSIPDSIAVLISSSGQLGTVSSSKRYKHDIQDVEMSVINNMFSLNPKTFAYNDDESNTRTYGLIAEEVRDIIPDLVVYSKDKNNNIIMDEDGPRVETVKYHLLVPLLVGAIKSLKNEVNKLNERLNM